MSRLIGFKRMLKKMNRHYESSYQSYLGPETIYMETNWCGTNCQSEIVVSTHLYSLEPKQTEASYSMGCFIAIKWYNTELLICPEQLSSLIFMLSNFRSKKVGVIVDIRYSIKFKLKSQTKMLRDFGCDQPKDEYMIRICTLGAICSHIIPQYVKNFNAQKNDESDTIREQIGDKHDSVQLVLCTP